ncbi:MAG: hypothetical protein E2O79_01375 [Caldithrix sp.]|nr:MAG: hypothetical protein E2O79_01375 [Caldithrix sp.]
MIFKNQWQSIDCSTQNYKKKYFLLLIDVKKSTSLFPAHRKNVFEKLDLPTKGRNTPGKSDRKKKPFYFKSMGFRLGFVTRFRYLLLSMPKRLGALAIIVGAKEFVRKENI